MGLALCDAPPTPAPATPVHARPDVDFRFGRRRWHSQAVSHTVWHLSQLFSFQIVIRFNALILY